MEVKTCLVLAIVLLGVAQHPVAESQHVLEVSVALISQILQLQHRTITLVCERSLQDAKDLEGTKPAYVHEETTEQESAMMNSLKHVVISVLLL